MVNRPKSLRNSFQNNLIQFCERYNMRCRNEGLTVTSEQVFRKALIFPAVVTWKPKAPISHGLKLSSRTKIISTCQSCLSLLSKLFMLFYVSLPKSVYAMYVCYAKIRKNLGGMKV